MRLTALLALAVSAAAVHAGFVTVGMNEPRQCNSSLVEWYGDDGPYHLLLTPTAFVSHGYNVWVPSIPNGTNSYNLSIDQPAGMQFMVTVWGASGIEYAGTTDVLTVLPSLKNDQSCFLSDQAITGLYNFAFNISSAQTGFPPQCSNLTMSWPTSLESDIPLERRDPDLERRDADQGEIPPTPPGDTDVSIVPNILLASDDNDTSSSNQTAGNTTVPPTMFGIIPLGNSFSIPITYSPKSKFSQGLPNSSLSKTPTTWTSQGVTHMNWTVNLAKGTRFIIVAGIGSKEQWASGGSSEMLTVGQGGSQCFGGGGDSEPKITASNSQGPLTKPTASGDSSPTSGSKGANWTGVIIACVLSGLGTLIIVLLLWFCCSVRRKRKTARKEGRPTPSVLNVATFGRLDQKRSAREHSGEAQLDLMNHFDDTMSDGTPPPSRNSRRPIRPISGATSMSPSDDMYRDRPYAYTIHGSVGGSRPSTMYDEGPYPPRAVTMYDEPHYPNVYSPTSPLASPIRRDGSLDRISEFRADLMGRQSSIDGLVSYPPIAHTPTPMETLGGRPRTQLIIHDRMDESDDEAAHLTDLKRETLAFLDSHPSSPASPVGPGPSNTTPTREPSQRHNDDDVTEYVVHRDAGRIAGEGPGPSRRVLELPPRYEELNWEAAEGDGPAAPVPTSPPQTRPAALPTPPRSRSGPNPHPLPTPPPLRDMPKDPS